MGKTPKKDWNFVLDTLLDVSRKRQRMMDQLRDAVMRKDRDAVFDCAVALVGLEHAEKEKE